MASERGEQTQTVGANTVPQHADLIARRPAIQALTTSGEATCLTALTTNRLLSRQPFVIKPVRAVWLEMTIPLEEPSS